jgi:hypothetical protein
MIYSGLDADGKDLWIEEFYFFYLKKKVPAFGKLYLNKVCRLLISKPRDNDYHGR